MTLFFRGFITVPLEPLFDLIKNTAINSVFLSVNSLFLVLFFPPVNLTFFAAEIVKKNGDILFIVTLTKIYSWGTVMSKVIMQGMGGICKQEIDASLFV